NQPPPSRTIAADSCAISERRWTWVALARAILLLQIQRALDPSRTPSASWPYSPNLFEFHAGFRAKQVLLSGKANHQNAPLPGERADGARFSPSDVRMVRFLDSTRAPLVWRHEVSSMHFRQLLSAAIFGYPR